ncbi:hypothetical protein T484DRAFT_1877938, partial [Baffinella frigidus]
TEQQWWVDAGPESQRIYVTHALGSVDRAVDTALPHRTGRLPRAFSSSGPICTCLPDPRASPHRLPQPHPHPRAPQLANRQAQLSAARYNYRFGALLPSRPPAQAPLQLRARFAKRKRGVDFRRRDRRGRSFSLQWLQWLDDQRRELRARRTWTPISGVYGATRSRSDALWLSGSASVRLSGRAGVQCQHAAGPREQRDHSEDVIRWRLDPRVDQRRVQHRSRHELGHSRRRGEHGVPGVL